MNKNKQRYLKQEIFSFSETLDTVKNLSKNNATVFKYIPMRVTKNSAHVYSHKQKVPDILKDTEFTPVFKKGYPTDKCNYRPKSAPSNFSKIFQKLIYNQVNSYMQFRRSHNTQHALLSVIKTCRDMLNKGQ